MPDAEEDRSVCSAGGEAATLWAATAGSPSGKAGDCKSPITGSIPVPASHFPYRSARTLRPTIGLTSAGDSDSLTQAAATWIALAA